MDGWLNDEVKELLFTPCLTVSGIVGRRLDNRRWMGDEMDERALTELLVDSLDTSSTEHVWAETMELLRARQIYLSTVVSKSTSEAHTGADLGFTIGRQFYGNGQRSSTAYSVLVQCKRIDSQGRVADFYHQVASTSKKQSTLMVDITPSSFYFVFAPPSLVDTYCTFEPMAFSSAQPGCSSAVWNIGSFGFSQGVPPFLSSRQKDEAVGILVVPALAVEAQGNAGKAASLQEILPNCMPLWYWFGEMLIPGFIGDRRSDVLAIAGSARRKELNTQHDDFAVRYSVDIHLGNG